MIFTKSLLLQLIRKYKYIKYYINKILYLSDNILAIRNIRNNLNNDIRRNERK